jgi:RND family efflux transporter MFP subunit
VAAALAVFATAAGCGAAGRDQARPAATAIEVRTRRPLLPGDEGAQVLPGRVKADEEVVLAARVMARLTALPVGEGGSFRRGAILATFDSPEAREALTAAHASLAAATVRRDRARLQEARVESLFTASVVAKSDFELAQVDRQAAEAAFAAAQANEAQWREGTALTAPFDGVVVRRGADPGQTLQPGMPVLELRSRAAREVLAAVPESRLASLRATRAEIQIGEGAWQPARIARIEGMTDPATRTRVAHFAPTAAGDLDPGAFARVRLTPTTNAAASAAPAAEVPVSLVVPASSLVRRGALAGVYVVADGRANLRWLRIGRIEGERAEVLAGLWPSDEVALDPSRLTDGLAARAVP